MGISSKASVSYSIATALLEDTASLGANERNLISGWIRSRNFAYLASCTARIESLKYLNRDGFSFLRQIEALFKKNSDFTVEEDCTLAAKQAFMRAERLCRITNKRLDWFYDKRDRIDPDLNLHLSRMESSICNTLGSFRKFLDALPGLVRVTSGATEDRKRVRSLPFLKVSGRVKAPARCWSLLKSLGTHFGFSSLLFKHQSLNRLALVPKNWKTHRTIACEPTGSLPLQLCFDTYGKNRLKRYLGIDLSDQTVNQAMAKESSVTGEFATIDLSMASDTLSFNTVAWMLPDEWFAFLRSVRSDGYTGPFGTGKYAKFSSMGNGATFVLETLVFSAACKAVGSTRFACYGDDLIIERDLVEPLLTLLGFLGFHVNREKSFTDGPFRESCGVDCWEGIDITPFYIRQTPKHKPGWSHLVNGLMQVGIPGGKLWKLLSQIAIEERLQLVPFQEDSMVGVWVSPHFAHKLKLIRRSYGVDYVKRYSAVTNTRYNYGRRSLFLWFFLKGPEREVSRVSTGFKTYRRRRCVYNPPLVNEPYFLWSWSDYLCPLMKITDPSSRRNQADRPVRVRSRRTIAEK